MSAGYSSTPLHKKLGITGDVVFTVLHAPPTFMAALGDYGEAIWQRNLIPPIDVVVAFYTTKVALRDEWAKLTEAAQPAGGVWVCWPKKTSGVASDITEDVLRATLLKTGWVDNKVCAIDDVWSGLRFVLRKENRPPWKR
jgi:hypothetical protein